MGRLTPPPRTRSGGTRHSSLRSVQGFTLVELLIATMVMTVAGLGAFGIILMSVNANGQSSHESTMAMLADAIIEQINSTLVGSGTANLSDCRGTNFQIATAPGGAQLRNGPGSDIDFSATPPEGYHMDYMVSSPCAAAGTSAAMYDLRWNVVQIGAAAGTPTNSFLVTVGAKRQALSLPIHVRVVVGRPE